ncbi:MULTISPECIES: TauD/TfdA family dioxygenase [unclassified Xanthobacter]|uniref:TauD/TfdA family dioxygenase n=1 Tax=unclassified Xanthobacter TaxID=2623496 RepID=UPI001EE11CEC|nr:MULTISPECIES: TauD/TfdA family dioxygenase [unclassified Xanthobacter]
MSVLLNRPIEGAVAWKGPELIDDMSWRYDLSAADIAALEGGLREVKARGRAFPNFTAEDFPLADDFKTRLAAISDELENGKGFFLLRGLPVARYTDEELSILFYGIGLHMGLPVSQNRKGDMLGVVQNVGDLSDKNTRVYETSRYLPYHTDLSDMVGLLSVRRAKQGGLSSLVSAATVFNEILATYPQYMGLYYRPMHCSHLGEDVPGMTPIFSFFNNKLSCRYLRQYLELGHDLRGVPLSQVEKEALDIFDSVIQDPRLRLDMMLEPGDIQFANNYAVMHSRTEFEDFPELERRRRLLRLWVKMPNARALAPEFPGRNGIQAA